MSRPQTTIAHAIVTLRGADKDDAAALRNTVEALTAELEKSVGEREHYSKAEAARLLEVSTPTLDKWVAMDLLPLQSVEGFKRQRIAAKPLLALAAEVKSLRHAGRQRGLLAEALSRLEAEDPSWRAEFEELYAKRANGETRKPADDSEFVSAAPGPDWDPED